MRLKLVYPFDFNLIFLKTRQFQYEYYQKAEYYHLQS